MSDAAETAQVAARKAWNEAFGPFPARYAPMLHRALEAAVDAAIEALVQDNERLAKIEQRAKDRLALHREYRNAYNRDIIETLREVIGEDDQLQGGSDK